MRHVSLIAQFSAAKEVVDMNVALWVGQIVLALVFAASGSAKLLQSKERLIATGQTGVAPFPVPVIRLTATCELLAAAGLLLPGLTSIASVLTPLAAIGLCVVMVGAAISHASLHEPRNVAVNLVIIAVALGIAVGRLR
jgi:uncharacterized membrane protein YphA (DoxX/SURF4 family)